MERQHHIRRQLLDFEFGDKDSALKWQQKVPSHYLAEYEKAIGTVLDQYDDGRCQQIDKIIVDLGTLAEGQVSDELRKTLDGILGKMLLKNVQHYGVANIDPRTKTTIDVKAISGKEALLYVFKYFVTHGNFPWNMAKITISELEVRLKEHFSMNEFTALLLSNKVFRTHYTRARFFYQFGSKLVSEVFPVYFSKQYEHLQSIGNFCTKEFSKPGLVRHFKKVTDATFTRDVLEWISLFAPDEEEQWRTSFIPWYIERQWSSKIPFSYVAIWVSADIEVEIGETSNAINSHLNKIFRHLDLHLSTLSREEALATTKTPKKEDQPQLVQKDRFDAETVSKPDHESEDSGSREDQIQPSDEDVTVRSSTTDTDSSESLANKNEKLSASNRDSKLGNHGDEPPPINVSKSPAEKEKQEPKARTEEKENGSETSFEKGSEGFLENKDGLSAKETGKERLSGDDETAPIGADTNHTMTGKKREGEFIDSKEFYREVEEILDVHGSEDQEHWEPGNELFSTSSDPYYISDSGMVLVWPYLNRLFEKLGYIKEKQFVSKERQERAVMILGYIGTGEKNCEEHQLVFAKFLCGWPFRMPVKKSLKLTKKELKEADAMLLGLISHWSVLKNTSIHGLRETFFYREGKLEEHEDDWKLTVEQKGTDILLDRLPYAISMIKLPWLKKLLRVDWV